MDTQTILFVLLAVIAAGGLAYAFIEPLLSGEVRAEKRQKMVATVATSRAGRIERATESTRKRQVSDTLKELEARESNRNKLTLEAKLMQAGLKWDKKKFYVFSVVLSFVVAVLLFAISRNPFFGAAGLAIGGVGLPNWILGYMKARRIKAFLHHLPDAIDMIVRGVRAGLPLGLCMQNIAAESPEPIRTEFRTIMESQTLGLPLADACAKLFERVPVPEANFFGIVIQIQAKSGGNLSEILSNLSKVLRDRKKMKQKVQAMSMEAKSSAAIIGSLPFIVGGLVYIVSPKYMDILFTTSTGKVAMIGGAFWMMMGILTMRKMINFDI